MATGPRAVVRLSMSFLATTGLALASVVFSEMWFYGGWRPTDSLLGYAQTVAGYGLVVQVCRLVATRWRVTASGAGAWRRVFLTGALYGWLVEGVLVSTVISIVPLSLSYTGLAWHALFSVLVGWWWIPRQLARPLPASLVTLVLTGVGIGAWASFWKFDHATSTTVLQFALYVIATTAVYAGGLALWWTFRGRADPGIRGSVVALAVLGTIAVVHAIANPLTLLGPALVGLALVALIRTAPRQADAQEPESGCPTPWRSLWRLVLVPLAATAVFALIAWPAVAIATGWVVVIVTAAAGAGLFVIAWWRSRKRPA